MANNQIDLEAAIALIIAGERDGLAQLYALTSKYVFAIVSKVLDDRIETTRLTKKIYLQIWEDLTQTKACSPFTLQDLLKRAHRSAIETAYEKRAGVVIAEPVKLEQKSTGIAERSGE